MSAERQRPREGDAERREGQEPASRAEAGPSFAEILAPVHEDFRKSGMTESELETLLEEALSESRKGRRGESGS